MDPFRQHDLEVARQTPPGEKLQQALDAMAAGFAMKKAALRTAHPDVSQEEIEALFVAWLCAND